MAIIGNGEKDRTADYQEVTQADWTGGMGTVIHKSVIEKIGYWDAKAFRNIMATAISVYAQEGRFHIAHSTRAENLERYKQFGDAT